MNNAGEEKITERVLYKKLAISILIIVLCMFAMSLSAYATFSATVISGYSQINGAYYGLDITVDGTPIKDGKATLSSGEHTVTLIKSADSTASTGFCRIEANGKQYYTQQIGADVRSDAPLDSITLKINVAPGKKINIEFALRWGTSVYYGADESALLYDGARIELN
jgi:hypothetical protein